ncbi:OmpH family outer membrane protein [SAR92 clade bacterium H921]|nr:OmpH family outer membrane protein [SAR92 clade bacterium H921]MDG0972499.1 OmpH family outer membrane protein [Porticoccaceae bacterium]MDG1306862.1 OmpH family outer membrane protein [Porticoccaceae bacterium]
MGKLKALVLVVSVGLFSVSAVAAEKIAVVDIARAIFGSNAAQASLLEAEQGADFVSLKAKYEGSAADLQSLAKEAETKRLTWSQEQAVAHQKKMEYAKADAELAGRKIQAEQKQLQQKIMQDLGPIAQQALQEIVTEEGVTILLRAESVMIASPESNLTAKVADRLNQKTK